MNLLDFFCGAGGVSKAFLDCGYIVTGIDIFKHPDYPSQATFIQANILDLDPHSFKGYDVFWFSPPCTEFSKSSFPWYKGAFSNPSLSLCIASWYLIFYSQPKYWIVENVKGSVKYLNSLFGPYILLRSGRYLWSNSLLLVPEIHPRKKQSYSGTRKDLRSLVPYDLAFSIAKCFLPG